MDKIDKLIHEIRYSEEDEGRPRKKKSSKKRDPHYWTVLVPWSPHPTQWHPTDKTGPFSVLTRGAFTTRAEAKAWAVSHLGGQKYKLRRVKR